MTALEDPFDDPAVLRIAGPLHASARATLEADVRTLITAGRRMILLDLAGVPDVDAAGVGALVHAYNLATAADAVLRIINAVRYVRDLLARVGLFAILNAENGMWEDHVFATERGWRSERVT